MPVSVRVPSSTRQGAGVCVCRRDTTAREVVSRLYTAIEVNG